VADIEAFERGKPELGDPVAKKRVGEASGFGRD